MPKWDEDFAVVLLRLATASLEATSVAGLGNEVGGVSAVARARSGEVELHRSGAVSYAGPGLRRGFANEITRVKVGGARPDVWYNSLLGSAWRKEVSRFGRTLWRVVRGLWAFVRGQQDFPLSSADEEKEEEEERGHEEEHDAAVQADLEEDYARFLRGEDVSDDEDDDAEFAPRSRSSSPTTPLNDESEQEEGTPAEADEEEPEERRVADGEAVGLYADLSLTGSESASAPLLLAHMTSTSASPLTRRRYTRLVSGPRSTRILGGEGDDWDELVLERQEAKAKRRNGEDDPTRRNCVVCTVEPRQIICWPCR